MEWVEEMKIAMKLMKDACSKNESWTKCNEECPFDCYCDLLLKNDLMYCPEEWEID